MIVDIASLDARVFVIVSEAFMGERLDAISRVMLLYSMDY